MATSCNIRVMCRFRPLNEREKQIKENLNVISFPDPKQVVITQSNNGQPPQLIPFTFDRVFPPTSTQDEVFETVHDTITDVLSGYNGTIFAYGQTGSGKTYTMFGPDNCTDTPEEWGIIPRSNLLIFNSIAQDTSSNEFSIKCSFLEIYMENIQDLLNPKNNSKNIKIRESKANGIWIEGLTEEYVGDENDIMELIAFGEQSRSVAKTKMNQRSSRSHSILIITIEQKSQDGSVKKGKLNLVDLAGSEKVSKTGAEGQTLEEAKKINQSLSLLGNCIHALTDLKREHIPFRDSKLTRLLQDSLGGNTKTTLMVTGSPHFSNVEETLSTLKFGARAKTIKNSVKVNQQKSAAELQAIVNALTKELGTLKMYSLGLENLVNYFKSPNYIPGSPIPKELEPKLIESSPSSTSTPSTIPTQTLPKSTSTPSNLSSQSKASNRHSVSLRPPSPLTSTSNSNGTKNYRNSIALSTSIDSNNSTPTSIHNSFDSELDSSTTSSNNNLFDPLAIVEMSIEIDKMKEENQILIDKFREEISEITIRCENLEQELIDTKQELQQSKGISEESQKTLLREQSSIKEIERNLRLENHNQKLELGLLEQRLEDLKLVACQVSQYLERKKAADYFDIGLDIPNQSTINNDQEEYNIEDIIRNLSEDEVLSMQVKLHLQNKAYQLEQKINQLESDHLTAENEIQQLRIKFLKLNNNNGADNINDDNELSNNINLNNDNNNIILDDLKNLKIINEKQLQEFNKFKEEMNIKMALNQNQIVALQNENQSWQNKLIQEKNLKQTSINQQMELGVKLNVTIKEYEDKQEQYKNQITLVENENLILVNRVAELELYSNELKDELASTQRLLASRKVVKIIRGDEKSMKKALESKVEFANLKSSLKKTGRSLF
ncbi:hypothetical protein CYY_000826 [Polysphondylium violaceum]|uniref:Kinesin-like protein n=1 Tax=Polysphondylium violaceum TaxID=133409 RepID=A0A8J4VB60_9MYCE|nr:hypothetical protein CYY_000826 [Polysphondylium violaceum]